MLGSLGKTDDRRRTGRLEVEDTRCSLGEVKDLSARGMRVERRGRCPVSTGDTLHIDIHHDGMDLPIDVEVMRVSKIGFCRWSFGLRFIDDSDETRRRLSELAKIATNQLTVYR